MALMFMLTASSSRSPPALVRRDVVFSSMSQSLLFRFLIIRRRSVGRCLRSASRRICSVVVVVLEAKLSGLYLASRSSM